MTYPSGETGLFWSPILSLHDVLLMVLFGVAIFVTRALLNRLVFIPMAHYFGESLLAKVSLSQVSFFVQPSTSRATVPS
jgi:hypothetical protein